MMENVCDMLLPKVLVVVLCALSLFGMFGNIMIIAVSLKFQEFQTKSGYILFYASIAHLFCLCAEACRGMSMLLNLIFPKTICFAFIVPYMLFMNIQCCFWFFSIFDILIAILCPIKYRVLQNQTYLLLMIVPSVFLSLTSVSPAISSQSFDHVEITECNLVSAFTNQEKAKYIQLVNLALNVLTALCFIITFIIFWRRGKNDTRLNRVMKRVGISALCYLLTWCTACILSQLLHMRYEDFRAYNIVVSFFASLAYSQNFYVSYWKSDRYRLAYHRLFKKRNVVVITTTDILEGRQQFQSRFPLF